MRDFSANVLGDARALVSEGRVSPDEQYPTIWWVKGEGGRYRVQMDSDTSPSWITCTCPHGRKKGAGDVRCKHAAAVLMTIETKEK